MRSVIRDFALLACTLVICSFILESQQKLKIAVISNGDEAFYWQAARNGAMSCGDAIGGVEIDWLAPKTAQNVQQQIAIVDQCVQRGVSGIVISPVNHAALVAPVARAMKKGIPVVVFDSNLDGEPGKDYVGFVGTVSRNAGTLAGEEMIRRLGGKGKVLVLRFALGQANLIEREEGFIKAIEKNKNVQLITKVATGKATVENVKEVVAGMLDELKQVHGVFCPTEPTTEGMLSALRAAKLPGHLTFIGFDTSDLLIDALKKGEIDALLAQDPTRMGYFGVKTLVDRIRGEKTQPVIDTGVRVVTKTNIGDPDIQKLIALPALVK